MNENNIPAQSQRGQQNVNAQNGQDDPYAPSYPESAARFLLYRIGIVVIAVFMIIIGKSNLPSDSVPCIQDVIIDGLQPVTNFYLNNEGLGLTLISITQLIVDIQLIFMLIYWFIKGQSLRYPIVLAILGISKILINILFQTKTIDNSFTKHAFPSFIFGDNFVNTYFFSGVMCLLMFNLLELYENEYKTLFKIQIIVMIYVVWILLSMRLNFFMDVATALVFGHYVFYFINQRAKIIDSFFLRVYSKITGQVLLESSSEKKRQIAV